MLTKVLLNRHLILVCRILAIIFVVALGIVSRIQPTDLATYTKYKQLSILFALAAGAMLSQIYAAVAEHISKTNRSQKMLQAICHTSYEAVDQGRRPGSTLRTTIFEPRHRCRDFWDLRLVSVARYVHGEGSERSSIAFLLGEGTVGIAFSTLDLVYKHGLPAFEEDPHRYLEIVSRECHIEKKKLFKSDRHPRCFLSIPIIYSDSDGKAGAVLTLDSTAPEPLRKAGEKRIKVIAEVLSTLYLKND